MKNVYLVIPSTEHRYPGAIRRRELNYEKWLEVIEYLKTKWLRMMKI